MSDFKICLVEPKIMHGVQHRPGEIIAKGKITNGISLEKLISSLISGKAVLMEVLNEDKPEVKRIQKSNDL